MEERVGKMNVFKQNSKQIYTETIAINQKTNSHHISVYRKRTDKDKTSMR